MRSRVNRTLTVAATGALMLTAQLAAASPAQAGCPAGQLEDPTTRICWSQDGAGSAFYTMDGSPCVPGQVGNCVGQIKAAGPAAGPGKGLSPGMTQQDIWIGMGDGGHK